MFTSFLSLRCCSLLTYDAGGPDILAVAGIRDQSLAKLSIVKVPVRSESEIISKTLD